MDVVLVGLPGSGKTAIGRRLAHRHDATYVDLDELIEREAGMAIPEIFADEGEDGFRARERRAVEGLGPADRVAVVRRVIATGGGAVVDPRNRWHLYRGRVPIWLDGRPEVLAQRLRRSPNVRPLVTGRDPIGAVRSLAIERQRFYAAANRVNGIAEIPSVIDAVEAIVEEALGRVAPGANVPGPTTLLRADTRIGRMVLGDGIAVPALDDALRRLEARRAILLSEPGAWSAAGESISTALGHGGWTVERVLLPQGEDAKRLSIVEDTARELARLRVERPEPIVAIGGGALGDAAGFVAATYLRGVPLIHVPTTLVAQIDSSIGGKTAVDLPEGKNLVGAFHQPDAIVIDVSLLRTLPPRQLRAALGEAVKMAALGDEGLFALLEADGPAIADGDEGPHDNGAVAEIVERAAWAKVDVVLADEREASQRRVLNLGHSLGHALEAAGGYSDLLHGEAVAYGLRAAARIGLEVGLTPPQRRDRIEELLTRLGLGVDPLPYPPALVREALGRDKKHSGGRLNWVLPTADGVTVTDEIPDEVVDRVAAGLLAASTHRVPA
jgi:shikimate kinase/3-dehydroquinate synthase